MSLRIVSVSIDTECLTNRRRFQRTATSATAAASPKASSPAWSPLALLGHILDATLLRRAVACPHGRERLAERHGLALPGIHPLAPLLHLRGVSSTRHGQGQSSPYSRPPLSRLALPLPPPLIDGARQVRRPHQRLLLLAALRGESAEVRPRCGRDAAGAARVCTPRRGSGRTGRGKCRRGAAESAAPAAARGSCRLRSPSNGCRAESHARACASAWHRLWRSEPRGRGKHGTSSSFLCAPARSPARPAGARAPTAAAEAARGS